MQTEVRMDSVGEMFRRRATSVLNSILCLLCLAACTTMRKSAPPSAPAVPPPVAAPTSTPGLPPTPAPALPPVLPPRVSPVAPPTAPLQEAPPAAALTMLVDSVPPGAIIVVDGRPVGKAPVRVPVPDTPQGFFHDYMEIRARFLATDPTGGSRTVTEEFTPREKVPAVLHFTPDGAQRTAR